MTIQEAIKSGKPFKRKVDNEVDWLTLSGFGHIEFLDKNQNAKTANNVPFWDKDFLEDDWEIKE